MATFVIVHGAWGGAWEWADVARLLRSRGHDVITPTLTGLGERSHLGLDEAVGLEVHVRDIVEVIEFEDLHDVVLVGASYGGMPVTGAATHLAHRIRLVIYVDGLVPRDGQSALDLLPEPFGAAVRAGLETHGPRWRIPIPDELLAALIPVGSVPDDFRAHYVDRLRDHPAASFAEPMQLSGAAPGERAFVRCTADNLAESPFGDPIEPFAKRARAEGWPYRELTAPHDPQVFDPRGLADVLEDLTRTR